MSLHKEARVIQLKTIIKDLQSRTAGYNVDSVAKRLNEQLKQSQEEYRTLTGNYLEGSIGVVENKTNERVFLVVYQGDNLPTTAQIEKALIDANIDEDGKLTVSDFTSMYYKTIPANLR